MFYDNYVRLCNSVSKSPSAVALEIGIAKPTVSRWKDGGKPTDATALKVADYFGVPISELTEEKEKAPTDLDCFRKRMIIIHTQEVTGSSPAVSTKENPRATMVLGFFLCLIVFRLLVIC